MKKTLLTGIAALFLAGLPACTPVGGKSDNRECYMVVMSSGPTLAAILLDKCEGRTWLLQR